MAYLKKCRVCGGNVSSEAKSCPHCGDPQIIEKSIYTTNLCPKCKWPRDMCACWKLDGPNLWSESQKEPSSKQRVVYDPKNKIENCVKCGKCESIDDNGYFWCNHFKKSYYSNV
jgi:hypothetical protein